MLYQSSLYPSLPLLYNLSSHCMLMSDTSRMDYSAILQNPSGEFSRVDGSQRILIHEIG